MWRLLLLTLLLAPVTAAAQPAEETPTEPPVAPEPPACPDGTCVGKADLEVFIQLAEWHKCRSETAPKITADSVNIVVDREGRVYGSGTGPKPYELHIDWCNYQIDAKSEVQLQVAQRVEPTWGFRFRPKATFGLLVADIFSDEVDVFHKTLDGGILIEPFYVQWFNLNVYVGVRSVGGGLGFDITTNFGAYAGYSITWSGWRSNPFVSIYFAF